MRDNNGLVLQTITVERNNVVDLRGRGRTLASLERWIIPTFI